jgi:hypothetical protein
VTDTSIAALRHKARRIEIKLHYARQRRRDGARQTRPGLTTLRLAELESIADDYQIIPDDENGRALIQAFVDHAHAFADAGLRVAIWLRHRAPWLDKPPPVGRRRWTADALAKFIGLTMAKRTRLRICTIGAVDCNKAQRKALRAAKHRERSRRNREKKRERAKRDNPRQRAHY